MRNITSGEYISTGHLPSARQAQAAVDEAYQRYRSETSGVTSQVYPALALTPTSSPAGSAVQPTRA